MQRKRVRRVWYGTAQRIRIDGGTTDMRWLGVCGALAVICGCHMEQGCNEDEAFHRFLGCPNAAANAVNFGLPQMPQQKKRAKRGASGCNTLARLSDSGSEVHCAGCSDKGVSAFV